MKKKPGNSSKCHPSNQACVLYANPAAYSHLELHDGGFATRWLEYKRNTTGHSNLMIM
jgi:hypothetical protein